LAPSAELVDEAPAPLAEEARLLTVVLPMVEVKVLDPEVIVLTTGAVLTAVEAPDAAP
jgi:hypothetical protein